MHAEPAHDQPPPRKNALKHANWPGENDRANPRTQCVKWADDLPKKLQVKSVRLDQHRIARPAGAEVQRVAAARVIHIDVPAVEEQCLALLGVAERGMAAFLLQVVGLGLDDSRRQPEIALAMADHLAQQLAGDQQRIAVEEGVGERPGVGPGQTKDGIAGHGIVAGTMAVIGWRMITTRA